MDNSENSENNAVRTFFEIDKLKNTAQCIVDVNCRQHKKPMKANHIGNLLRHLEHFYKPQHREAKALNDNKISAKAKKRKSEDDKKITVSLSKKELQVFPY